MLLLNIEENNMSDMLDDINKYAAIWDNALEQGIFKDSPKPARRPVVDDENSFFGADFFGQNLSSDYDMDAPLNESQVKYWNEVSVLAGRSKKILSEENVASKDQLKNKVDKIGNAHNPVYTASVEKDQEPRVTQNWGVGGKEHFQLEDLKVRLGKLESKLNSLEGKGENGKTVQSQIDKMRKQIDKMSDELNGNRYDVDG